MSIPLSLGHDRKNRLHSWDKICLAFVFCSLEESLLTTLGKEKCHNIYSQIVKVVLASFYFGKLHVANIKNFPHHLCYILFFISCSVVEPCFFFFFFSFVPPWNCCLVGRRRQRWFLYFEVILQTVSCQIHLSIFQEPTLLCFTL